MAAADAGSAETLVRIGELARRAGIPAGTLRAWERRYGIVVPRRTEGGYRLYSEEDERRLRAMVELIATGVAPAQAAEQVLASREVPAPASDGAPDSAPEPALQDALFEALMAFDEDGAEAVIDDAAARQSVRSLLGGLLLPVLRRIGSGWRDGEVTIAQEHFASNLVRARMLALARGWGAGHGPLAMLACPSGEQHDLGLITFGIGLRGQGWRIAFFGADAPTPTLEDAAGRMEPDVIVLAITKPEALDGQEDGVVWLADRAPVLIAGAGASPELAERIGARHLAGSAADAAESMGGHNGAGWLRTANGSSSTG